MVIVVVENCEFPALRQSRLARLARGGSVQTVAAIDSLRLVFVSMSSRDPTRTELRKILATGEDCFVGED